MNRIDTIQRRVMNGYRRAAIAMADARALHISTGNSEAALSAYRHAAALTRAAQQLEKELAQ